MWEMALWNAVLTPADVALLYAGGLAVHRMPLAVSVAPTAYWPMNDGADGTEATPTLFDHTGNGHTGTDVGDPQWVAWPVAVLGAGPLSVLAVAAAAAGHPTMRRWGGVPHMVPGPARAGRSW